MTEARLETWEHLLAHVGGEYVEARAHLVGGLRHARDAGMTVAECAAASRLTRYEVANLLQRARARQVPGQLAIDVDGLGEVQ